MSFFPVVFIAKKQIASWPIFGDACRSVATIFVDRDSNKSRREAALAIGPKVLDAKQSIAVFPSGTTTMDEAKPWRRGAFRTACDLGIPVQPFRIRYEPLRTAAYLMEDVFAPHIWRVLSTKAPIHATVELGEPRLVKDVDADVLALWEWSRQGL